MEQTSNYQLNQWDKTDRIQMEDFNADNAKLEAALAQEATARTAADTNLQNSMNAAVSALETSIANNSLKVMTGTFTGNGSTSVRTFELGVKPNLLVLRTNNVGSSSSTYSTGAIVTEAACLHIRSSGVAYMNASGDPCGLTDSGFIITAANPNLGLNAEGTTLSYWCLY